MKTKRTSKGKKKVLFGKRIQLLIAELKERMKRKHNGTWRLYAVLRSIVILIAIRAVFTQNYEYFAICLLVLVLFLVPSFLEKKFKVELPSTLEKIILMFVFAAEILGEIQEFYVKISGWDTMLHTLNGFLCAAVGFALIDLLNSSPNIKFTLSPVYCVLAAFCFSMTVGVVWEFFEFGMDYFFHLDMQKDTILNVISSVKLDPAGGNTPYIISGITSETVNGTELGLGGYLDIGLYDTMKDLIVNFLGAAFFSIFGYRYIESKGKNEVASRFIPVLSEEEEDI